jgi:N-acetylglucosamine repressor
MKTKATRQYLKNQNTSLVLRTIYQSGAISRADISRLTDLTRPTVSSIVSDLIDTRLVTETGFGPSIGGKPPLMLQIDTSSLRVLCVDIGNQEFRGALINLRGEISERISLPAADLTGDAAVQQVYQLIDQLTATPETSVLGIGIGTPGLIDPVAGMIRQAVNLDWHHLPLREMLEARYNVPIYLANDAQAAALGEFTFGARRSSPHLLLIKIGRGIGSGVILNGELFHGDGFGAGEIGHVVLDAENNLTLENIASTTAMLRRAREIARRDVSWADLVSDVTSSSGSLRQMVEASGESLGIALAHLIATLNIHNIVIAGRVDQFGDILLNAARNSAAKRVLPELMADTTLRYSELETDIVLMGCAALILKFELAII